MAKFPGNIALKSTTFFLNLKTVRNSVFGISIITTIQSAAASGGSVTDTQYDEYITYTAWRFSSYIQHNALSS